MVAHLPQGGDQQLGVALIDRQIGGEVAAQGGDLLEQAGGVDVAQRPPGAGHGGVDLPLSVTEAGTST